MSTTLKSPATKVTEKPNSVSEGKKPGLVRADEIKIKTILVPVDFSRPSIQALNYAVELAKKFASEVHLLYVTAPDDAAAPGAAHLMRQTAESMALAREKLLNIHEKHAPPFWPQNSHVRSGQPFHEICQQARELDADLIVLATRGHSGLKRILLGSTAERVVRFAPCPVLVVRKPRTFRIREILIPTDFSQCAIAGAMYGARLAKALNAKIRLFHAVPPTTPVLIDRIPVNVPEERSSAFADARLEMKALSGLDFFQSAKCETSVRSGYVADSICGESAGADLVVISTHGRTGMKHALIGSVAEQVVRYAECPVMVVPSRCAVS